MMERMKLKAVMLVCLLTLLSGCKITPPVTTDYDGSYDFSKLRSYAWVAAKDPSKASTLESRRQINAIETILNRKGFTKIDLQSSPDFLIRTHTIKDKKISVNSYYNTWGYYPYYYPYYHGGLNYNNTFAREYEVGTLVLDIVDPIKKEIVWRGSVSRKLGVYTNRTPEERNTLAFTNAEYLLVSFPPSAVDKNKP